MRGTIITFQDNKGIISGHDGNRYHFAKMDWLGEKDPSAGQEIDFTIEGESAKNIFILPSQSQSKHSKTVLALVAFFIGILGIHRFMVGKVGTGIAMLLISCTFFGLIATSIWAFIDFILLLTGSFTDKDGNKITT